MLAKPTFLCAIVAVACAASGFASAQTFPNRPIRIVVGFAPAGPADVMARLIGMSRKAPGRPSLPYDCDRSGNRPR
jgi:tripartite-type tricarboxylate transporter receptor subunit TctC